ncbi:MAG: hypothetical protein ACRCZI_05440 [Cetobacterium sp.]
MKAFIVAIVAIFAVGCTSSRTYVASPMESEVNGERYHWHNLVVLKDKADMFHVTESRSWMEYCKTKIENPVGQDQWDYPYQNCVREGQYLANGAPSVAQQAVTPMVNTAIGAGGFVAGMHLLGKGIGGSRGSTINNNNSAEGGDGTSSASSSSEAKAQANQTQTATGQGGNGGGGNSPGHGHHGNHGHGKK